MAKHVVVFVLGRPGSGKGTQCRKICQAFDFVHLSAGDLLREEQSTPGSQYGQLIADCLVSAKIVPVDITCSLLKKAMDKHKQAAGDQQPGRFLIDGFPRNQDNYDGWQRNMADKVDLAFVLYFDVSEDLCLQRCLSRGAAGSGRTDDNEQSLRKRMDQFKRDAWPIIQIFESEDKVRTVDGGREPELVFQDVRSIFSQFK